jgi:hypothetical protein
VTDHNLLVLIAWLAGIALAGQVTSAPLMIYMLAKALAELTSARLDRRLDDDKRARALARVEARRKEREQGMLDDAAKIKRMIDPDGPS